MDQRIGRLERIVDVLTERVDTMDEWVSESKKFHRDMNTFRDTFVATQAAVREEQKRRHEENSGKLNVITVLAAIALVIVTALGIVVSLQLARHQALNKLVGQQQQVTAEVSKIPII